MGKLCGIVDQVIENLLDFAHGFTVKEVVETAREVTGHPIPAKEEARRAGDPSTLIASSGRAKGILGWKPQYADLKVIIETAWKWHQAHPHGYKAD